MHLFWGIRFRIIENSVERRLIAFVKFVDFIDQHQNIFSNSNHMICKINAFGLDVGDFFICWNKINFSCTATKRQHNNSLMRDYNYLYMQHEKYPCCCILFKK